MAGLFLRLYSDADTWQHLRVPVKLMHTLISGEADLASSRLRHDQVGASTISARTGACWLSLPHGRAMAFSNAIGLSAAARGLWNE